MRGNLNKNTDGPITVITDKGEFNLHKDSFGRHLKDVENGKEVKIELKTEGCPFNYTARCTSPRCDCNTKKYAKII
jgi:hypothetical protein